MNSNENYEQISKMMFEEESCNFPNPQYKPWKNVDHFCAWGNPLEKGDSGGPVMVRDFYTNQYTIIGISSSSWKYNGRVWEGAIFTKVAFFRQWILKQMQSATFCGARPDTGLPLIKIVHCPLLPIIKACLNFGIDFLDLFLGCVISIDLPLRLLSYIQRAPKKKAVLPLSYKDLHLQWVFVFYFCWY